jgi:hypothetical protein
MQQGSSVRVSREVEPEQSVRIAQQTAEMIDNEKVETKTENKETVTEEKAIKTQVSAEKLIDVPIEKNMEDDVSETRVKRQHCEGVSDSEVEGNIKQECATELSGVGKQCAQVSPSHMLWQQDVQMNENEICVESFASNRREDQRIEIGSQRGGAPLSGCRRRPKALSQSDERGMESEK